MRLCVFEYRNIEMFQSFKKNRILTFAIWIKVNRKG